MSDIAIKVENLSKRYRIGLKEQMPDTFVGAMTSWLKAPLANYRQLRQLSHFSNNGHDASDIIWALKDVSFEVKQGEVVGIIGRNGAGKSTLLKIFSRITEPTSGRAIINGRVSSLLEVGTGFHEELTGRENVYLNGTILGMSKKEIDRKFDEIVDFSGVEKFIDTPVKRYSSGMQVRLAFAVAAHLEPEILLVDEVLAVGDAEFQKKCLGKMGEVAKEGRTVLFVSHNMGAINQLCEWCVLLRAGIIHKRGLTQTVVNEYLSPQSFAKDAVIETGQSLSRSGTGEGRITKVGVYDESGNPSRVIGIGRPFRIRLEIELPVGSPRIVVGVEVKRLDGLQIANIRSDSQGIAFQLNENSSRHAIDIDVLAGLPLYPGTYLLEPWFCFKNGRRVDHLHGLLSLSFESSGIYASELMIQPGRGIMLVDCGWDYKQVNDVVISES